MKKVYHILFLFILISCINLKPVNSQEKISIEVAFNVWVYNLDLEDMTAEVKVRVRVYNLHLNASNIEVILYGKEYPHIICDRYGSSFQGESEIIQLYLDGVGDMFPFDRYEIHFSLYEQLEYVENNRTYGLSSDWNYSIDNEMSFAYLYGEKGWLLKDIWSSNINGKLPVYIKENKYNIILQRKSFIPYLQFIFPLILGEFIMLLTLLVKNDNLKLLRIYTTFIAFSPLNTLAIQEFLPHRRAMSLPEFLSVIIFLTSIILIIRILFYNRIFNKSNKKVIYQLIYDYIFIIAIYCLFYTLYRIIYKPIMDEVVSATVPLFLKSVLSIFIFISILTIINAFIESYHEEINKKLSIIKQKLISLYNHIIIHIKNKDN